MMDLLRQPFGNDIELASAVATLVNEGSMNTPQPKPEDVIEAINTNTAKGVMAAWLFGLACAWWFSSDLSGVAWWEWAILAVVGSIAASIVIGGGASLLVGAVTRIKTGSLWGSTFGYVLSSALTPIVAFFASWPAIELFA
jgi:hypothetical protein